MKAMSGATVLLTCGIGSIRGAFAIQVPIYVGSCFRRISSVDLTGIYPGFLRTCFFSARRGSPSPQDQRRPNLTRILGSLKVVSSKLATCLSYVASPKLS